MARRIERLDARRLYCEDLIEIPEIAIKLNVPEKTVYRWKLEDAKKGNDWDKDREQMRMTSFSAYKQTLKIAIDKLREIAAGGEINVKDADAITKMIKAAKSLHKDVDTLGNILLATSEFVDFLQDRSPETLDKIYPYISEFGQVMSRKYGKRKDN